MSSAPYLDELERGERRAVEKWWENLTWMEKTVEHYAREDRRAARMMDLILRNDEPRYQHGLSMSWPEPKGATVTVSRFSCRGGDDG